MVCPACGQTTQPPVPDDVVGQFGPQLTVLIAYLTVLCRLPRRLVQTLLEGARATPSGTFLGRPVYRPRDAQENGLSEAQAIVIAAHHVSTIRAQLERLRVTAPIIDGSLL